MAVVPDFGGLAAGQKTANDQAANQTNMANRPNQYNPLGNTTWGLNPDGSWGQSTSLSEGAQGVFNNSLYGSGQLSNQLGQGLDYSSLGSMPKVGGYNQQVIDSWNALQNPGLNKSESAARARAAAMGITMGSNAWQDQERALGNTRTDAGNKAILAGYTQGNTEYDQALRGRQQGATELQNRFSAANTGLSTLNSTRDSLNPNKWNANVPASAAYTPTTIYGAAQDTFNANRQNENADIAKSQANTDSAISALKAAGGVGGVASALGGAATGIGNLWTGAQSLWNGASNLWNSWGSQPYSVGDSTWNAYNALENPT